MNDNIAELEKDNINFLCKGFIAQAFSIGSIGSSDFVRFEVDKIDYLKKSIEIVKSGQFPKGRLKERLVRLSHNFLNDLFFLREYEKAKIIIDSQIKAIRFNFENDEDKNYLSVQDDYNNRLESDEKDLDNIKQTIALTIEFRDLLYSALPTLEADFLKKQMDWVEQEKKREELKQSASAQAASKKSKEIKAAKTDLVMNLDLLDELFVPEMTKGVKPTKLDRLKTDLRANVFGYEKKDIAALAAVIYDSGMLHKNMKPKSFNKWKKQFSKIVGKQDPTVKQGAISETVEQFKNAYYYLNSH